MSIRKTVVSGSFYRNNKDEILKYIENLNKDIKTFKQIEKIRAIIVPHAGYIYSGNIANQAYFHSKDKNPKRVIVIGPSHHVYLKGASVALYDDFEPPIGNLGIDK